ncbi:glyoxylase-like metal-dependent hydrolase (beta-lactamase superfamily II) [Kribbella orskensis]|uniref:Glyoxylase-like metal-dependent hydrolase (Beta-lactamase superfamily II) n=1 Tax=Kribbella orskensis TaxID=2512216 RepID=A0ABY2BB80_9ACTN|nr:MULTISPECIES: MBL fold metallo-hydrolase [Kribbella]TCN34273.1 glyoxylase-like metal-dependent hydrolase (beta-lactamase superfamily II) [Kribbella sp. VKM Ac-2500]TCO14421.1 glyoxylase-like metal-dependent hydrolase (beta-lactamase superfamily II) [Kribbella orskensis]
MSAWAELGDRCWVRRYPEWDLNVGLVVGSAGALVIDTRATTAQAEELLAEIRELTDAPVRWVVNTHAHFDHTFGNGVFTDATSYAQENAAAALAERGPALQQHYRDNPGPDPRYPEIAAEVLAELAATKLVAIDNTFAVAKVIDLGDRRVELLHLGNAHTDGDLVVVVPDADVYFVGDLLEESAPPSYGDDSFPLEWPDTLDRLIGLLTATSKVVPGHGAVVDAEFARDQAGDLGTVANTISGLHHNGTSLEAALAHTDDWPWPTAHVERAVRRGYAVLGTPRRPTLPLLGPGKSE